MKRYIKSASYHHTFDRGPAYTKLANILDDIVQWGEDVKGKTSTVEDGNDGLIFRGELFNDYLEQYGSSEDAFSKLLDEYQNYIDKDIYDYMDVFEKGNVVTIKPSIKLSNIAEREIDKKENPQKYMRPSLRNSRQIKSGVENLDKIKEFEKRYAKIKGDVDKEEDLIQYYVGRYGIPEETLDEIAFNLRINSSRQIKSGLDPYLCCPNCGEPELFENIKENNIKCYNCGNTISYDDLKNLKKYVSPHSKITSARYIATNPESGEVLGSADTYEEAVNEWGEDVTITDSEVGDGMDTTQGGILSSWDNDTPRGEGWLAHDDGKQKNECPYERGTDEYEDWIDGWEAAYQEVNSSKESNHQFNQRIINSVLTKEITEDDAIKQIASRNNMNIGFAKRIFNNLMEDKSLIQSGVMEIADDINKDFDLNGDLYSWFDDYVEDDGKSTTVGGELVRAAHRIIERFENDGDKIGMRYGKETVNPAARYILAICNDYIDRNDIEEMLYNESRINYSDEEYDAWIQQFERTFEDYLRNHEELFHSPNKNDMWDYKEEDDVSSSVSECCIYDNEGNEYWFQKDEDGWKCTNIEFGTQPEYEVDETFSSASDFEEMIYSKGEQKEPYGFFSENGLTYNWEGITEDDEGNYREWVITDVSVDDGLADVGDVWSTDDFNDYTVYDANGREINVSDLY